MSLEITKGDLTRLVHDMQNSRRAIAARGDSWRVHGSSYIDYERTFEPFSFRFREFLSGRQKPIIIDLLSSTHAIKSVISDFDIGQTRGIAVSLSDHRSEEEILQERALGLTHISGDLSGIKTWNGLKEELDGEKADLVIERGLSGCDYLPENGLYFLFVARRIWNMLSSNDGTFISDQLIGISSYREVNEWIKRARTKGVDVRQLGGLFKMVKHKNSPTALPY